uniref:Uncharacterized protein n=1 Tax=Eutreptiella gymnastica TaxID=73025 RepID=A0A6U7UA56_9EUGL
MDRGLTMILDVSSDPAADRSPMNISIVSHRRVYFMDIVFLNDECCAVGVGKCIVDWWTAKFERRQYAQYVLVLCSCVLCRLAAKWDAHFVLPELPTNSPPGPMRQKGGTSRA